MDNSDVITHAAIAVEYGQVVIDGKSYICPVRAVAISADRSRQGKIIGGVGVVNRILKVRFIDYRKFGSTSRILTASKLKTRSLQPLSRPSRPQLLLQPRRRRPEPAPAEATAALSSEAQSPDNSNAAPAL